MLYAGIAESFMPYTIEQVIEIIQNKMKTPKITFRELADKFIYKSLRKKMKIKITIIYPIKETVNIECKEASINQEFLLEDIPALIKDLPNLLDKK